MLIGYNLKKLRELRNFTQAHMAKALKVTQSTYCRYENNELYVTEKVLEELSLILGISPQAILKFDTEKLFEYIEMITKSYDYHTAKEIELYEELVHSLKKENEQLQNIVKLLRQNLNINEE